MAEQPTLAEALKSVMDVFAARTYVSRPAQVTAYDNATQTVTVRPVLKEATETDDQVVIREMPLLQGVPVAFPRAGGFFVSFPIQVDDYVLLVCSDRSLDVWLSTGGIVDPIDLRRHELSDAIAIPGVYPGPDALTETSTTDMVMGQEGGMQISIDTAGAMVMAAVGAATQAVALAGKVETELGKVQTAHNTHKHITTATVGPSGVPGILQPPVITYTPGTVGSSKVSAEE